jgi:hypothetical protein
MKLSLLLSMFIILVSAKTFAGATLTYVDTQKYCAKALKNDPDLLQLRNQYLSKGVGTGYTTDSLNYVIDTSKEIPCYKSYKLDGISKAFNNLIFDNSLKLAKGSDVALDDIVAELEKTHKNLPPLQKDEVLNLTVNGHTGFWKDENFLTDFLAAGSSKTAIQEHCSEELQAKFNDFMKGFNKNTKYEELSKNDQEKLSHLKSEYFITLSRKRAEHICDELQKRIEAKPHLNKVKCNPQGKGDLEATFDYENYKILSGVEQGDINKELRRATPSLSIASVSGVEKVKDNKKNKFKSVHYSATVEEVLDTDTNLQRIQNVEKYNEILKQRYGNNPDRKYLIEACKIHEESTSNNEQFEVETEKGMITYKTFQSEKTKSKAKSDDEIYAFNTGILSGNDSELIGIERQRNNYIKRLSDGTRKTITQTEFEQLVSKLKKENPKFESTLDAARAQFHQEHFLGKEFPDSFTAANLGNVTQNALSKMKMKDVLCEEEIKISNMGNKDTPDLAIDPDYNTNKEVHNYKSNNGGSSGTGGVRE